MPRIQRTNRHGDARSGLTIVELIIAIVIVGLIFPLFGFILNTYRDTYTLDDKVKMSATIKQALWYMDDTVRIAYEYAATVPTTYPDPYGPHNAGSSGGEAWSYKGDSSTSRVLITKTYATTTNALDTGRQPVFENTASFDCATQMYYQPQLPYVTVYFVKDGTLYRRVLTDTTTALCPGNTQQQKHSCPPYITSGRDASCQANDEALATNVTTFSVSYYQITQDGTSEQIDPTNTSTDPTILASADYAMVTLTTSTQQGHTTSTATQRIAKVNQ